MTDNTMRLVFGIGAFVMAIIVVWSVLTSQESVGEKAILMLCAFNTSLLFRTTEKVTQ